MQAAFAPPMPPFAPDRIGALGVLTRIRRNAFSAFPARCFDDPAVRYPMPGRDLVLAAVPETMGQVLAGHPELYRRVSAGDRIFGAVLGRGLASSEGEAWRRQRRTLAPAFTPRTLPLLVRHMVPCVEAACVRLESARAEPADLLTAMQELSLDVACTTMFSLETAAVGRKLRDLLLFYAAGIGQPRASDFLLPRWAPTLTMLRRQRFQKRWYAQILRVVEARRSQQREGAPRDLFDLLSDAYAGGDEELLVDEVSTMIFAGHETTGLTMFWACYLLANAPDWQHAIRSEAAAADLSGDGAHAALAGLPITRAVVDETLRLYPPAYMTARRAHEDHELAGVPVRRRSIILLPFNMLHRNPRLWTAPERFDPDRFLGAGKPDRYAFLPFGAGPRVCIGAQLATSEATLVLARLVRDNHVTMDGDRPVLPVGSFATRPSRVPAFRLAAVERHASRSRPAA